MLVAAHSYSLFRGRATQKPEQISAILVVQTAKLGDMVCATPVFRAIREKHPEARIVVIGDALNREVLADNHDVDSYIVSRQGFFALLQVMRREHFDASVVLVPDARAITLSILVGASLVVAPEVLGGYCPWMTKTYRLLLRLVQRVPHRMEHYAPGEYLKLLEPLGIYAEDTKKHLSYSDEARKNADTFLRANGLIEKKFAVISPSAGNKIKNWPADRFARVAEHIVENGMPVVVIGGLRDKEEVTAMMLSLEKPEYVIDASGKFSIDELKAFIATAGLFVAIDTGPIYIAEAFGVPTVDIVGPMDEREQPPIGPHNVVVIPQREKPALHIMNARVYDEREARRQIETISVEMVCEAIDNITVI